MTRRLETGPLLVTLGAVLLLVSLFLAWYTGDLTAWDAFEVWDLVLAALAVAAILAAIGLLTPDVALVDRRWLPGTVLAALVVVAVQIVDPPPAAAGQDVDTGAWLAFGGAVVMGIGALLTFSRVRLAVTVEGRDPRRHVPAVDARGEADPATGEGPAVPPAGSGGGGLFGRVRRMSEESPSGPGASSPSPASSSASGPGSEAPGAVSAEEDESLRRIRARRRERAAAAEDATEERPD
jgi:hypothetical protein